MGGSNHMKNVSKILRETFQINMLFSKGYTKNLIIRSSDDIICLS